MQPRVIQRGKEDESYHCRKCGFTGFSSSGSLAKAKRHSMKTGHTVDVYYESRREVTYYRNGKNEWRS